MNYLVLRYKKQAKVGKSWQKLWFRGIAQESEHGPKTTGATASYSSFRAAAAAAATGAGARWRQLFLCSGHCMAWCSLQQ